MNKYQKEFNRQEFREALYKKTHCAIQHTGWTCGTCFFAIDDSLTEQDWQAVLYLRGDYRKKDLDNLPDDISGSLKKILDICGGE